MTEPTLAQVKAKLRRIAHPINCRFSKPEDFVEAVKMAKELYEALKGVKELK